MAFGEGNQMQNRPDPFNRPIGGGSFLPGGEQAFGRLSGEQRGRIGEGLRDAEDGKPDPQEDIFIEPMEPMLNGNENDAFGIPNEYLKNDLTELDTPTGNTSDTLPESTEIYPDNGVGEGGGPGGGTFQAYVVIDGVATLFNIQGSEVVSP